MRRTCRFFPSTNSNSIQQSGTVLRTRIGWYSRRHFGLRVQHAGAAGQCFPALDDNSTGELRQFGGFWDAFHLSPINAGVSLTRMKQPGVEGGFVTQ